ncbi:hypothetical protein CHLRE_03g204200v5 [Chlamydomonas reinhardtii]|uniref:YtxH domain-containing protein n=1 Tax=Chlamydomonas reinhardtii TaxID=3055 RepID=A8IXE1_CHLRE|nr:uncharacterized protein CHLRE_03g204200v5 [Chlamydomonas reinhardtii]PNW85816.1 hypothetical protein CHLRE_03g204200v5 [Chlamydomonas reinhardtii]|eukprot:XP_001693340.1 predicted protein [Chlamydomonas reinhardtii]
MTRSLTHRAEKAGEDTANCAKTGTRRVRNRLQTDEDLRRNLIIGGIVALGTAAVGTLGWFIFKRRDDIKKSLKDAKHKIQEKIEHHKDKAHDKPATGHA